MILELRVVLRLLGYLTFVLAALIMATAVFGSVEAIVGDEHDRSAPVSMLIAAVCSAVVGIILFLAGKKGSEMIGNREALLLVALGWILGAALSAIPFYTWAMLRADVHQIPHNFDNPINCYFESMSGLTTTGATIVEVIGTLPRTILLWRAITHWLGGLGIIVLFVAVLPMLGVGSRRLYRIEAPGPTPDGVMPRIQDAARTLWKIYFGLTLAEIIALMLCGMSWFDATCHTFATLATGGFSTLDNSIAGYSSTSIHLVIILFMVIAGINFSLYHQLLQRQWKSVLADRELRVYFSFMIIATIIVSISLLQNPPPVAEGQETSIGLTVRDSLFQVVAVQTTTGFCTADFDTWGFVAKATLLILMFVGGMAGSTGGGIKVVRIMTAFKVMLAELEHVYRPRVLRSVKIGKVTIDPDQRLNALVYLVAIAFLFALGTIALMLLESSQNIDITTAATASIATLNNIGPGLARVGATQNYAWFSDPSKIVMCVLMVLGRLEMFTILALFTPRFWRNE